MIQFMNVGVSGERLLNLIDIGYVLQLSVMVLLPIGFYLVGRSYKKNQEGFELTFCGKVNY